MGVAKNVVLAAILAGASLGVCAAENLVLRGDFSESGRNLAPECRAEAGRVSLHVEDRTWNHCGKCEVTEGVPDREHEGCVVHAANVLVGFATPNCGFAVTPETRYDVAFDAKSLGAEMSIAADVVFWTGDSYWKDRTTVKSVVPGGVKATGEWRTFRGSFRAPQGARRAALRLAVWSSTKWPGLRQYKPGDAFLFDNVRVVVSRKNIVGADEVPATAVAVRKTIAEGDEFDDFVSNKDGRTPAAARTRVSVAAEAEALLFTVAAEVPGQVVLGKADAVWSGDTIEILVEGVDSSRTRTHVAFNNAGAKYTNAGPGGANGDWDVDVAVVDGGWTARARLPFSFLGIKKLPDELGINVGRARAKERTFDCWSPGQSFHDPASFGRIVFDGYSAALRREFGVDMQIADRAAFESAWAKCEADRQARKLARFKESKMSVAPVSTLSDWSIPFLPEEIFDPPSNIVLKAAVNEIRALPIAVANLSDRVEDYRVVLETDDDALAGQWGLRGFPQTQIVARKGLRFRDVSGDSPSIRFDPLARMDDVGSVTVPPREAGLVWYDFDCSGVKPGVYGGRLRVIPLCEDGKLTRLPNKPAYKGKAQTIPVSLEVVAAEIPRRAAAPAQYFLAAPSQAVFDMAFNIGAEGFQLHSWAFAFERDADGNLDLERPKDVVHGISKKIAQHEEWAARHGFAPEFVVCYSAMDACAGLYGCAKDDEKFRRVWPQYVRGVKKTMNAAGVPDSRYIIEVRDEPRPETLGKVLEAHRQAKEACPTVRLMMLLAAWKPTVAQMREFIPFSDRWDLWRGGYFAPGYRDFVKELQSAGKEVRAYSCDTSVRLPLLQYYRHHAWHAERHALDGVDMYQLFDHIHGGKFGHRDFQTLPYGGLMYGSFGEPAPSLRYMALREGFTDCKMLAALKARRDLADDPEVAEFLRTAALEVVDRRPNDAGLPDRMRDRARELLVRRARPAENGAHMR